MEDVTIEDFEIAALDRLRVLAEIESCYARNRSFKDTTEVLKPIYAKYIPMDSSTAKGKPLEAQRRKDHLGHFVLRLAFCRTWASLRSVYPPFIHSTSECLGLT